MMIHPQRFAFALVAALLIGCAPQTSPPASPEEVEEWTFAGPTMGTRYRVVVPVGKAVEDLGKEAIESLIFAELADVDDRMSTWKPDSEVSRFNAHRSTEPIPVSDATLEVVVAAQGVSRASDGAFDITVGPLIEAWGFGAQEPDQPPSPDEFVALAERIGYEKLAVDQQARTLTKQHPALEIDLSAIAKGYAVDRVAEALERAGVDNALVEVGGEVYALGRPAPDRKWRVAIERPDGSGASQQILELENQALATSGDYRNFRPLDDGRSVSHLFDPRTQIPIQHAGASVSVVAPDCTTADAWATALFVLGPENAASVVRPPGLAVRFILHAEGGWEEL